MQKIGTQQVPYVQRHYNHLIGHGITGDRKRDSERDGHAQRVIAFHVSWSSLTATVSPWARNGDWINDT